MTDTTEMLSIGQQLKNAREALNLSITDVAQKTNLKKAHLEAIEEDIFILPNVPPTFMRGYVRNYLRFLRLPEELVSTVNYGEVTIPKEVKRTVTTSIPVKNNQKSQTRWVKWLTWIILLAAIGMTLAWWWQEHKKEQASSAELVSNVVEVIPAENAVENSVELPVALNSQEVSQASSTPENTQNNDANSLANNNEMSSVAIQPNVGQAVDIPVEVKTTNEQSVQAVSSEPVNVLQQPTIEENTQAKPDDANTDTTAQAVGNDELRIEITNAASWITVRGVKNKKLAEKLYNAGEVLTFNGNEQYRLTVGAPANVKIYYKGQQVPLKIDGRVARFKLPLAN
ncbi:DNA-binding protein [Vespertiliibacter pulmonis]|uniref:Cytoskeleton protein RodZ n=1 Tax=Vespertiliibacter pulmonis TaxID=1443036 RepID=A0A3N4VUR6_9PAST|nr:RodZ domain-containing protein [Vespertiliibacter pulmonis]QLB21199.1 DNA-binding protein [Vespertiliibacter pulmonis]RPE83689.1 cytoskeleton protein RodZ [Vespertiliibacter pulmonis]